MNKKVQKIVTITLFLVMLGSVVAMVAAYYFAS